MAALILGGPTILSQSLNLSSRFSFSRSETLAVSFDSRLASLSISATSPPPVPSGIIKHDSHSLDMNILNILRCLIFSVLVRQSTVEEVIRRLQKESDSITPSEM